MKYVQKGNTFGTQFTIHEFSKKQETTYIVAAKSLDGLKRELAGALKEKMANLGGNQLKLGDVRFFNEFTYSNYDETDSEYVTVRLVAHSQLRTITVRSTTKLNPQYESRPTCGLCYKQVTQVFDDHLLDDNKTPKKVCKKCSKDLAYLRTLV